MIIYHYLQKTDIEFYRIRSYQYYSKAILAMMHFNAYLQDNHDNEAFKQSAWESTFTLGTGFKLSDDLQYS